MHINQENLSQREPWNAGRIVGAKPPLKPKHICALRTRLQIGNRVRDLAMFNLAIDSKLRGCDLFALKVEVSSLAAASVPGRWSSSTRLGSQSPLRSPSRPRTPLQLGSRSSVQRAATGFGRAAATVADTSPRGSRAPRRPMGQLDRPHGLAQGTGAIEDEAVLCRVDRAGRAEEEAPERDDAPDTWVPR